MPARTARAPRRPIYTRRRRAPRYRLLLAGIGTLLLLVFLVRSCGGRSSAPDIAGYVDSARLFVQRSNEVGERFKVLVPQLAGLNRDDVTKQLETMAKDAGALSDEAVKTLTGVPAPALSAHGFLLTALRARADGVTDFKLSLFNAASNPDDNLAALAFQNGLTKLALADLSYDYFTKEIQGQLGKAKQKSEVPASTYVAGTDLAKPEKLGDYVKAVRESETLKATLDVAIASFDTEPPKQREEAGVRSLPADNAFAVKVTITNKGTQKADNIVVAAALVSSEPGQEQSDSDTIKSLLPGDSLTVVLRKLRPGRGDATNRVAITVTLGGDVDPTNNTDQFKFRMAK